MKFISSLVLFYVTLVFANVWMQSQSAVPSCSYGTFYNGAACQDCGLASANPNVKIVGGVAAAKNSLPAQVYLRIYKNGKYYLCGGTLISRKTVMTAAHCLYGITTPSSVTVVLGAYDISKLDSSVVVTTASKLVVHSSYSPNANAFDIALIHLGISVTLKTNIGVACLPQTYSTTYPEPGTSNVITAGWGLLYETATSISKILQNVRLSVYSASYCNLLSGFNTNYHVCAGEYAGGKDTCQGDSGGGLLRLEAINGKTKQVVSGITSYGYGCARAKYPGVYTRVSYHLSWIRTNMIY